MLEVHTHAVTFQCESDEEVDAWLTVLRRSVFEAGAPPPALLSAKLVSEAAACTAADAEQLLRYGAVPQHRERKAGLTTALMGGLLAADVPAALPYPRGAEAARAGNMPVLAVLLQYEGVADLRNERYA